MRVEIKNTNGFSGPVLAKLQDGIKLVEHVTELPEFHASILKHTYSVYETSGWGLWKKTRFIGNRAGFVGTKMPNGQVLECLMSGATELDADKDGDIDLHYTLYTDHGSSVIGYTYPSTLMIWANSAFWSDADFDAAQIAGNIFHEYAHKCGFDHLSHRSLWPKTVPYAVGNLMVKYARKLIKEGTVL